MRHKAVLLALLLCVSWTGFSVPVLSESIWSSPLCVREGVSDFNNKSFSALFRDAKFQEVVTPRGDDITFKLEIKSQGGNEAVIDFIINTNGVEAERFTFSFRYSNGYTLLYRMSSDRGNVEGSDELMKAMQLFYLPCLLEN